MQKLSAKDKKFQEERIKFRQTLRELEKEVNFKNKEIDELKIENTELESKIRELQEWIDRLLEFTELSKEQINELWFIAHKFNISVICYGLKSNFKGNLFEGSEQLFARADEKHELTVNCVCGKVAMFNARRVNGKYSASGKEVVIDGVNDEVEYIPLCADHYLEFVMKGKFK